MSVLLLSLLLSHATISSEAPPSPPASEEKAAPTPAEKEAPAALPLWKTLPDRPMFVRAFSGAVLAAGATVVAVGAVALGAVLAIRFTPALDHVPEDARTNTMALCTLAAATGGVLGAVLVVGGTAGLFLP